jgi:hypothetical protein
MLRVIEDRFTHINIDYVAGQLDGIMSIECDVFCESFEAARRGADLGL